MRFTEMLDADNVLRLEIPILSTPRVKEPIRSLGLFG
jgi:hypothetical protein